jgi:Spy/CpxP family protein refolding chaperone
MPTSAAATAAAASAVTAASAATTAATATGQSYPLGRRGRTGIFLIEDIKGRQANVGDFLLAKKDFVAS